MIHLMDPWGPLVPILLLLAAATLLGMLAQRLRQNAILGYLLSGVVLGRSIAAWGSGRAAVETAAEVGVALLLFTIGLEFSLRHLAALGARICWLGIFQIAGATVALAAAARWLGFSWPAAVAVGLASAMSSTSVALRLMADRSELDSRHGRAALGVALLQDLAVIPAMLLIPLLAGRKAGFAGLGEMAVAFAKALAWLGGLYVVLRWAVPPAVVRAASRQNRDLPVLVSAVVCLGASWASHSLGLSAVLGAFAAGLILAGSPFAPQIRADVVPLRAAFLPLFFSSIGMLAAVPAAHSLVELLLLTLGLAAVKTAVVVATGVPLRIGLGVSLRTGLALAQIGEFSFVLFGRAQEVGLLDASSFSTLVAVSVLSLLASPLLVQISPGLARAAEAVRARLRRSEPTVRPTPEAQVAAHVVVVGFGPAGRRVAEQLRQRNVPVRVIDSNPKTAAASSPDLPILYGDAAQTEILERAGLAHARAVVITVPDPGATQRIIAQVRTLSPSLPIVVRARYHIHQDMLRAAGADRLVSEEVVVGRELAAEALAVLGNHAASPQP